MTFERDLGLKLKQYMSFLAAAAVCCFISVSALAYPASGDSLKVDIRALKAKTDLLMKSYRFSDAVEVFLKAEDNADSTSRAEIDRLMAQAQNGESMTGFCCSPVVVARQRFPLKDFFLYYPLGDGVWRSVPNQLDKKADEKVCATFVPEDADVLYWSSEDQEGIRNIYRSEYQDTIWSAPGLLSEQMTSDDNEIYPMLSPDGSQLFFASKGLYGMGGYDLYVADWDYELNDWGLPVNMGFPFSSPYNDFLFINTDDGQYSIFASDRNSPADSVDIYVLEYDSMPVRKAIDSPEEIEKLCRLDPAGDAGHIHSDGDSGKGLGENDEIRHYAEMLGNVRNIRESIASFSRSMDECRNRLADAPDSLKASLSAEILSMEAALPVLQDSLLRQTRAIQQLEMSFLRSGVVIDPESLQRETEREVVGSDSGFRFTRHRMGPSFSFEMKSPEPEFDYSFQILPEGRFALDNTLPDGLVYQIQLFALSSKATVKQIKGLSPVFERRGKTGKYGYSAGLFKSYKDVLSNLNKVKRAGFRDAIIVAFLDGSPVTVTKARTLEKSMRELFIVRIFPADGNSLNDKELAIVKVATEADMSRSLEDGVVSYIIGPVDGRDEAERIAATLKISGIGNLRVESAGMKIANED